MSKPTNTTRSPWLLMGIAFAALIGIPLLIHTPPRTPTSWGPTMAPLERAFDARWKQRFLELGIHRVDTTCMTKADPQVCYVARDERGKVLGAYRITRYPVPSFENYAPPSIVFHFVRKGLTFEVRSPLLRTVVAPADAESTLDQVLAGLVSSVEARNRNARAWDTDPTKLTDFQQETSP